MSTIFDEILLFTLKHSPSPDWGVHPSRVSSQQLMTSNVWGVTLYLHVYIPTNHHQTGGSFSLRLDLDRDWWRFFARQERRRVHLRPIVVAHSALLTYWCVYMCLYIHVYLYIYIYLWIIYIRTDRSFTPSTHTCLHMSYIHDRTHISDLHIDKCFWLKHHTHLNHDKSHNHESCLPAGNELVDQAGWFI